MRIGPNIVRVVRTELLGSGVRSVWYLPDGSSVHAIEDNPIPAGTYFLNPDETGRFRNWVIECELGTRVAVPNRGALAPARKDVEVHVGNELDDTDACTCPGMRTTQAGVQDSIPAIRHMRAVLDRDDDEPPVWVLEVVNAV